MEQAELQKELSRFDVSDGELERYWDGTLELKDLLGLDPHVIEQLKGRAQFFVDGEHDERALLMLEMLEELDRTDPTASVLAVEILLKLGLSDRAEEKVSTWLERAPEHPDVLVAKAQLELSVGRWVDAATTLEQVISADPDSERPATQRAVVLARAAHEQFERSR